MRSLLSRRGLALLSIVSAFVVLAGSNQCRAKDDASPAELVQALGSERYNERQAAEQQLNKAGTAARDELLAGLKSADPEIRRACRRILADVLEDDLQRRLKMFRDDPSGAEPDLPGWQTYRSVVGDTPGSRRLFATLVEEEAALMESLEAGSGAAVRAWVDTIYQTLFGPNVKQREQLRPTLVAALLLAMTQHEVNNATIANNLASQLMQPQFAKLLTEGESHKTYHKLMSAWINGPDSPRQLSQKLMLVMRLNFRDGGLTLPVRILDDAKARPAREVSMAVEVMARLGGAEHAVRLTPLLKDQRMCQLRIVNKKRQEIQVRDVALAYLVHVTNQNHADYGMPTATSWFSQIKRSPQVAFNFHNFTFSKNTGESRDAALKKWNEWVAGNPLAAPPEIKQPQAEQREQDVEVVAQTGEEAGSEDMLKLGRADRALVYQLNRAREAIGERRYADACEALGMLLALDEDFYFQPQRDAPLYQQLRTEAEQLLSQLPTSGLKLYELRYGPIARAELRAWQETQDNEKLIAIQRKYFFTEAGSEASYLLGTLHRTAGHPVQAAIHLERLARLSPFATNFEPALSLQLATCWRLAGLPERASDVLQRLPQGAAATVRIGGESIALFSKTDDRLAWLDRAMGPGLDSLKSRSPAMRAELTPSPQGGPFLQATPLVETELPKAVAESMNEIVKAQQKKRQTVLPVTRPLVVDDIVVHRGPLGIEAVDLATGELRWKSPLMNGLWHLLRYGTDQQLSAQRSYIIDGLRDQLWEDPSFGQLSCNGGLVFAVENASFQLGPDARIVVVRPDGRRELDSGQLERHNQLVAYDVQSGKVRWELGGAEDSGQPLAGGRFCGPPLCVGDYLYSVVEVDGQSLLVSLDAATGTLLDRYLIDVFEEEQVSKTQQIKVNGQPPSSRIKHRPGARPIFSDGTIVCCTSKGRYVAVDLASRTVRWAFAPPAPTSSGPVVMGGLAAQQKALMQAMQRDRSDRWSEYSPRMAGAKVLLTPWNSDKLFCLNVADGRVAWTAPREDGLYVAGVDDGRVMIVARSGARMLALADGKPSFSSPARWPIGAVPSGRGYFTNKQLHVPMSSGEVAAVDLATGRLVARSRAPGSNTSLGNLVRLADFVISCDPEGVDRFPTLQSREAELDRQQPTTEAEQVEHFVHLTEVMLYQGKTTEVIQRLQENPDALQTPEGARLFTEATLQWSGEDWKRQQTLAAQVEESLTDPVAKADFLTRLVRVYRDANDDEAGLAAAWRLVDVPAPVDEMVLVSPARSVQRGRFLRQTLSALLAAVPPETRAEYDTKIRQRLAGAPGADWVAKLGFHPAANVARLRLAAELDKGNRLQAELLLRQVLEQGEAPQKAEAAARLATLLAVAGKHSEAARFYQHLAGPLADVVCLDGKTGGQLAAELAPESPVGLWLKGRGPWPSATPEKKVTRKNSRSVPTQWAIVVSADGSPLAPLVSADIDVQKRTLIGRDAQGKETFRTTISQNGRTNLSWSGNAALNEACATGHLMIAWMSGHIVAIDQFTGKTLWSQTAMEISSNQWWMLPQVRRRMILQQQVQQGLVSASQLPRSCVATTHCVVFQEGRILKAVDPLTGEEVWSRDDLPPSCELQGDAKFIQAKPEGSNTALLFNAVDGSRAGQCELPADKDLLARVGSNMLYRTKDKASQTVELFDVASNTVVWTKQFGAKAACCQIDNCELAVMEPKGKFTILSLRSGEVLVQGQVKEEPELRNLLAFRGNDQYVLIANRPEKQPAGRRVLNQYVPGQWVVEGNVHCLDGKSGDLRWTREVVGQAIKANYPPQAPILTFFRRHQSLVKNGNSWRGGTPETRLTCLDRTTGKPVHDEALKSSYDQTYGFSVDPKAGQVKIETRMDQIVLTFKEKS